MAVAVIQGDRVVWSKGYGVRVEGEPAVVETSTVFQIGSISKSFTATVMGTLVDEGKVKFEDRVIDRYPDFQMYDPWVTREFMVWDLSSQHSGMAPYAGDSAVSSYYGRPERDYTRDFLEEAKARMEAGKFPDPPARPAPARDLAAYAGTYVNPYFGKLTAEVKDGRLAFSLGPRPMPIQTRHWDGDAFALSLPGYGGSKYTDGFVSFQFGQGDKAAELRLIRSFDDAGDGRFTRAGDQ